VFLGGDSLEDAVLGEDGPEDAFLAFLGGDSLEGAVLGEDGPEDEVLGDMGGDKLPLFDKAEPWRARFGTDRFSSPGIS